jgi:hypothetical protein
MILKFQFGFATYGENLNVDVYLETQMQEQKKTEKLQRSELYKKIDLLVSWHELFS